MREITPGAVGAVGGIAAGGSNIGKSCLTLARAHALDSSSGSLSCAFQDPRRGTSSVLRHDFNLHALVQFSACLADQNW